LAIKTNKREKNSNGKHFPKFPQRLISNSQDSDVAEIIVTLEATSRPSSSHLAKKAFPSDVKPLKMHDFRQGEMAWSCQHVNALSSSTAMTMMYAYSVGLKSDTRVWYLSFLSC